MIEPRRQRALAADVVALAADVGHLRKRLDPTSYDGFLVHRIAGKVEDLHIALSEPASEICRLFQVEGLDEDEAADAAIAAVEQQTAEIRQALKQAIADGYDPATAPISIPDLEVA